MSEVQVKESGEGGKNKQKKQTLRVDFTPMVDMNMLLITFFMFCTTLLKPQTMNINMPSNDTVKDDDKQQVKNSGAITLLLAGDDQLYYYEGMPKDDKTGEDHFNDPDFLHLTSYEADGLREYLIKRNVAAYEQIQELKVQLQNQEIPDSIFRRKSKEIYDKAKETTTLPTVMIKPTDFASYKNLVDVLDEMLVTNIGPFAVIEQELGDRYLLYKKTNDGKYLTPEQVAEASR
ncbi:biopolymer transporter ExbD [Bacteroidia bacterium]|nr:biopolymer transporter ExbD [Bacteroidia bacterium]GHT47897.1 biopolymer transporter ExbD [Bacteroidia bacterium]